DQRALTPARFCKEHDQLFQQQQLKQFLRIFSPAKIDILFTFCKRPHTRIAIYFFHNQPLSGGIRSISSSKDIVMRFSSTSRFILYSVPLLTSWQYFE